MLFLVFSFFLLQWALTCVAAPRSLSDSLQKRQDTAASDLPCLAVMSAAEQGVHMFAASDVYECISKVPFNAAIASRFIDYYNETLQFQSTLGILKNPPEGYQQPPVNVQEELETIKANIDSGAYKSQYAFEAELQLLISRFHDNHVTLDAGVLSAFRFASPYTLVSLSQDGQQKPQVYLQEDILAAAKEGYTPYPVVKVNGVDVVEYLTSLVAPNSDGYVEPHADWNSLMNSPVKEVQEQLSIFQRLPLYPGDELNFTFENGTELNTIWLALYAENSRTGPLTTPGDFFNFFVMGLVPAGFDQNDPYAWWPAEYDIPVDSSDAVSPPAKPDFDCSSREGLVVNWCNSTGGQIGAFPNDPVVVQNDFSITGAGAISGYIMDDISTGIISIPGFYQDGRSVRYFFNAIDEFIGNATERNTKRLVIDLQQNGGGLVFLAMTTFQQFFPRIKPYTGSRIRSHESANVLGTAYSQWWQSLDPESFEYEDSAASEWVAVNRINAATGLNFSSWSEYFGPILDRNDAFSQKQLYNLSDRVFDYDMFGWTYEPWVNSSYVVPSQRWAPEDIVLLTDGLCSSACALFVELMTELAGVRTISVGGRPEHGPMQTASGNRGAAVYNSYYLDDDYNNLQTLVGDKAAFDRLPSRNDTGMFTKYASINIRDQMRPDDLTPLQFRYEASDCRFYYTPNNVYNMSQLWRDAATATWDNTALCVPESTTYSNRAGEGRKTPPKPSSEVDIRYPVPDGSLENPLDVSLNTTTGLMNTRDTPKYRYYDICSEEIGCANSLVCVEVQTFCSVEVVGPRIKLCLEACNNLKRPGNCQSLRPAQSTQQQPTFKRAAEPQRPPFMSPPKPAPVGGAKPPTALPQPLVLPPKTSQNGFRLYSGYVDPGIVKTSRYRKTSNCAR